MRTLLVFAVLALVVGAGCVTPGDGTLQGASQEPSSPSAPDGGAKNEEQKQFCDSESGCKFWDEDFHEYVLYEVDSYVVDVLIVPSASADSTKDTAVMKAAVKAWADGVQAMGEPWFAEKFKINVYVLGQDSPPAEALQDPEIVVLAAEYNPVLLFGIGLEPKQLACESLGQQTLRAYPVHAHDGMEVRASDCTGTGFTCFAINTNFLTGTAIYLQDLVAHEFGHCLGGGHVGDALDFSAKRVPIADIMSYQHDEKQVHCVSNMNVRVLESLYAPLLDQTVEAPLKAGGFYTMPQADYAQVECPNPG